MQVLSYLPQVSRTPRDEVGALTATYDQMQAVIATQRQQLQAANTRLAEQVTDLKAANHELEAFSYSVSHDLRAPLRSMDGFSKILTEEYGDGMPEEARHYLERVRENAQKMDHLVSALLALSRLGRQAMAVQPVEPRHSWRRSWGNSMKRKMDGGSKSRSVSSPLAWATEFS